jgi:hypothetical protein
MNKDAILQYIKEHWLRYLLSIIFVAVIVITNNALKEDFSSKIFYSDGLFIGGALLIGYGFLVIFNYFGAFDIFQMMFNRRMVDGRREQYYEYSIRKRAERKPGVMNFIDYMIVGVLCLIIARLLLI